MPIYVAGNVVPTWKEYNQDTLVATGNESDEVDLPSTGGFYGHFFIFWSWDTRTAYPWLDAIGGDGLGFGILNGTHGSGNYVFRELYSNNSSVSSLDSNSFKITNSTGDDKYLNLRIQAWSFNPDHSDG